ncbi:hypothetical protein T439DRAFT_324635 [Meredithblackwellia eburnea MCA 4105]
MADLEGPPGYNDYLFHLGVLHNLFYPSPMPHFTARTWVLGGLLFINVLAVVPALTFLWLDSRKTREAFWIWKWVRLRRGQHLVLNSTLIALVWTIPTGIIFMLYTYYDASVFIDDMDQKWIAAWRATVWTPMLFQSWFQAWALFQAYVVLADSRGNGNSILTQSPRTLTITFFASTFAVFLPLIVMQILTSEKWMVVWSRYMNLQDQLEAAVPLWTPDTPDNFYVDVHTELHALIRLAANHGSAEVGIKSICTLIRSVAFLVNILSVSLFLTLRRQVNSNKSAYLDERSVCSRLETMSRVPPPVPQSSAVDPSEVPTTSIGIPPLTSSTSGALSISIAEKERRAEERRADFRAPTVERIQNLEEASGRVSTVGICVFISSLASCCVFGWTISVPSFAYIAAEPWTIIEVSLFLNIWIWALFQPPITYKLAEHALKRFRKRKVEERRSSNPAEPCPCGRRGSTMVRPPEVNGTPEVRVTLEKDDDSQKA